MRIFTSGKHAYKTIFSMANKGGVGKSLLSTSLAFKLSKMGIKVGILDADVSSPTVPRMLGMKDTTITADAEKVKPIEYSPTLKFVSVGSHPCIIGNRPTVWRGERHRDYITQCLTTVNWGDIDFLIVDFPAGLSDALLGIKRYKRIIDGVVLISAPAKVCIDSCERAIIASQKLTIPIVGIIENKSYFVCDKCGTRHNIYGGNGAGELANKYDVEFLGEIPILKDIAQSNDIGKPIDNEVITKTAMKIIESNKTIWQKFKNGWKD